MMRLATGGVPEARHLSWRGCRLREKFYKWVRRGGRSPVPRDGVRPAPPRVDAGWQAVSSCVRARADPASGWARVSGDGRRDRGGREVQQNCRSPQVRAAGRMPPADCGDRRPTVATAIDDRTVVAIAGRRRASRTTERLAVGWPRRGSSRLVRVDPAPHQQRALIVAEPGSPMRVAGVRRWARRGHGRRTSGVWPVTRQMASCVRIGATSSCRPTASKDRAVTVTPCTEAYGTATKSPGAKRVRTRRARRLGTAPCLCPGGARELVCAALRRSCFT